MITRYVPVAILAATLLVGCATKSMNVYTLKPTNEAARTSRFAHSIALSSIRSVVDQEIFEEAVYQTFKEHGLLLGRNSKQHFELSINLTGLTSNQTDKAISATTEIEFRLVKAGGREVIFDKKIKETASRQFDGMDVGAAAGINAFLVAISGGASRRNSYELDAVRTVRELKQDAIKQSLDKLLEILAHI